MQIQKLLIANRGEIALRIHRACHEMGIKTVAVHSTADADAMHVRLADETVCIGPPPATESYLNIPNIISAAEIVHADAIHPGYGFLSENAQFAEIVESHNIIWVGPKPEHIRMMGDKIEAKRTAAKLGLPLVPGSDGPLTSVEQAKKLAAEVGYPVLIKAASGGGGRGMKVVPEEEQLESLMSQAASEAARGVRRRHRLHGKISRRPAPHRVPGVRRRRRRGDPPRRARLLAAAPPPEGARGSALAGDHQEGAPAHGRDRPHGDERDGLPRRRHHRVPLRERRILLHRDEHPAAGRASGDRDDQRHRPGRASRSASRPATACRCTQEQVHLHGHAIECRINAEDPETFAPSPGLVKNYVAPGGMHVRVDSGLYTGYRVPPYYDSMIGKLIVYGRDRAEAIMRLRRALEEFVVEGMKTTVPLHQRLVRDEEFLAGDYTIKWLEQWLERQREAA